MIVNMNRGPDTDEYYYQVGDVQDLSSSNTALFVLSLF